MRAVRAFLTSYTLGAKFMKASNSIGRRPRQVSLKAQTCSLTLRAIQPAPKEWRH